MTATSLRVIGFEREWNSVEALARLAGASDGEVARLQCLDAMDEGTCLSRNSATPCAICWARSEHERMNS